MAGVFDFDFLFDYVDRNSLSGAMFVELKEGLHVIIEYNTLITKKFA